MNILSALRNEASKLEQQLAFVDSAINALGGKNSSGRGGKGHFTAASKAKMAASQRARWAKVRAAKKNA